MITDRTQYLLLRLAEEATEVAHAAHKAAHFGLDASPPDLLRGVVHTNRDQLVLELTELAEVAVLLGEKLPPPSNAEQHYISGRKLARMWEALKRAQALGLVSKEVTL